MLLRLPKLSNAYKDCTVSEATCCSETILNCLIKFFHTANMGQFKWVSSAIESSMEVPILIGDETIEDFYDSLLNEELWPILNEIAPNGCYFGAHPGDGALFGFWSSDGDQEEDSDTPSLF